MPSWQGKRFGALQAQTVAPPAMEVPAITAALAGEFLLKPGLQGSRFYC